MLVQMFVSKERWFKQLKVRISLASEQHMQETETVEDLRVNRNDPVLTFRPAITAVAVILVLVETERKLGVGWK